MAHHFQQLLAPAKQRIACRTNHILYVCNQPRAEAIRLMSAKVVTKHWQLIVSQNIPWYAMMPEVSHKVRATSDSLTLYGSLNDIPCNPQA